MKRWLRNKLLRFLEGSNEVEAYPSASVGRGRGGIHVKSIHSDGGYVSASSTPEASPILNFRVYGATGGWVIEFSKLDRQTGDRIGHSVNVVADHESFLEDVNSIIQMELLRV